MDTVTILYEHPEWFKPLFSELDRRQIPYEKLRALPPWSASIP